jgi:FixJ family two-component response regulator
VLKLLSDGNSSLKAIEFHRAKIREKLGVTSLAELFRLFPNGL